MDPLQKAATSQDEQEFYTPYPDGYIPGKTKYVVVTGSVMSGLGKGIFSSALARLLKNKGLKISPIKFDGYLNQDAGTLNPYRHGEVFVLDCGLECDMDLGTYERFLDQELNAINYLTSGRIFGNVLAKERKGGYLGRDVQFIPHVTGEIKLALRKLAMETDADVVFLEVGGTVGDIENTYFIEALRELIYEEGDENCCKVSLTYVMEPGFLGEQKSKAAQIGIRQLMSLGMSPDIIAVRSENPITEKIQQKIGIFSSVPQKRIVGVHDQDSIYKIPMMLHEGGIDDDVVKMLGLQERCKPLDEKQALDNWKEFVNKIENKSGEITVGITGKYATLRDAYASILKSVEHCAAYFQTNIKTKWIETTDIEEGTVSVEEALKDVSAIIVPGGFGKRGAEGKIKCVQYAREKNLPYLGLCYGFQMALVEFARNVLKLEGADTTEIHPEAKHPVIDILPEQKQIEGLGGNMRLGGRDIEVKEGTLAHKLYGSTKIRERFRHRFECNPEYIEQFENAGIVFSGKAPNRDIMQILELKNHPFFVGVQFHPEFKSRPLRPHPLFKGLIEAALHPDKVPQQQTKEETYESNTQADNSHGEKSLPERNILLNTDELVEKPNDDKRYY